MDSEKIKKTIRRVEGELLNIQDAVSDDPELAKSLHLEKVILEDQLENLKAVLAHLKNKDDFPA